MQQRNKALFILSIIMIFVLYLSIYKGSPRVDTTSPLPDNFPEKLGVFDSHFTLFCQNELCLYSFEGNSSNIIEKCPKCSGNVGIISLAEARILPKGTKVKKLIYNSGYTRFYVSMVVTGEQRSGIHRPQWCLPSQGLLIQNSKIVKCTISSEHSFKVTVLEVEPRIKTTGGGYFAYWFTDKEHEVATHWQRLYWMAYNDVVIGERRPWGYVSIWMPGKITSASYEKLLNFIKKLYPALKIENN